MPAVPSQMIELGSSAVDFNLPNFGIVGAKTLSLAEAKGDKGTVIAFICNHCPYVVHIEDVLSARAKQWQAMGVNTIAISANDIEHYPQDAPDKMTEFARANQFDFPYLYDADQGVAQAYQAACTPDFYLFDSELKLVYRGQFCPSRPGNDIAVTGDDLHNAVNALAQGTKISDTQVPSIGCSIKWIKGNEPAYG